jgi:prolyl-tRNA editing enzyme YbaK/EbsC (Cys-tRNA(Pro) deacylase)
VPPVGHAEPLLTFVDEDLLNMRIWAAAGTPNAVFRLMPADLVKECAGRVVRYLICRNLIIFDYNWQLSSLLPV